MILDPQQVQINANELDLT